MFLQKETESSSIFENVLEQWSIEKCANAEISKAKHNYLMEPTRY